MQLEMRQEEGERKALRIQTPVSLPPGSYTPQAAVRGVIPQEWRPSRLRNSPPPTDPRRTSYTLAPADESFPEEEEDEDWDPPARSVVGMP